jgi:2-polyprenyl-6-methoxyphenol hydroxylase-like FAD-dependent oxidoreductase
MMEGFLLARAGVDVVVLEKHADFLRDFRSDTIHPSTLELLHELGLLDAFLRLPHDEVGSVGAQISGTRITVADFSRLSTTCKFLVFMPQWDFLDFMVECGRRYRGFHLMMKTEATDLIEEGGRIVGVQANAEAGAVEVRADLTISADGRHSTLGDRAGFRVDDLGAPMDVLWMRLSRRPDDDADPFGHFEAGRILVMLNRGDRRLRNPEGFGRRTDETRYRGFSSHNPRAFAMAGGAGKRAEKLGRCETPHGRARPSGAMVPAGTAVHWRRRSRNVPDRWRRHQSRYPGRGSCCQHSGRAVARRHCDARPSGPGASPAPMADAGDAGTPARHPESRDRVVAGQQCATETTAGYKVARLVSDLARHPGAGTWDRGEARARPNQRGKTRWKRATVGTQRKTQRRTPHGKEISSRVSICSLRATLASAAGIPYRMPQDGEVLTIHDQREKIVGSPDDC